MRHFEIPISASSELELANGELHIVFLKSGKNEKTGLIAKINLAI
jgi:copper(I)-binding protein